MLWRAVLAICLYFCFFIISNVDCASNFKAEIDKINEMLPIIPEGRIFFWRPQKVGSSTILSLLLSYSFRYNIMSRRKGAQNSFCLKIADCINQRKFSVNGTSLENIKVPYTPKDLRKLESKKETILETAKYQIVTGHHICNLQSDVIYHGMKCAYENNNARNGIMMKIGRATDVLKEIFVVRDPLNRAISVYYFWGELYRMKYAKTQSKRKKIGGKVGKGTSAADNPYLNRQLLLRGTSNNVNSKIGSMVYKDGNIRTHKNMLKQEFEKEEIDLETADAEEENDAKSFNKNKRAVFRLGEADIEETEIQGRLFKYHGNETTPPPADIAQSYAANLRSIFKAGMPGPSFSWSLFSNNLDDAVKVIQSDRMVTVVTERLDESLVVAAHYLNWTIADVVVASPRKALSGHPKHSAWPPAAVKEIVSKLEKHGEYAVYEAAQQRLNTSIAALKKNGVDFDYELQALRELKSLVTKVCFNVISHRKVVSRLSLALCRSVSLMNI